MRCWLERQLLVRAASVCWDSTGSSRAESIPIIKRANSSSPTLKPARVLFVADLLPV